MLLAGISAPKSYGFSMSLPKNQFCHTQPELIQHCKDYRQKLQSLQNKVISLLPSPPNVSKYVFYNVLDFDRIFKYFTLLKFYRFITADEPSEIYEQILSSRIQHGYPTRQNHQLHFRLPLFYKSKCQQSFIFQSLKMWNNLPTNLKCVGTFNAFKRELKLVLLQSQR